ncbi:MAG TPA: lamin tail domain-containing protein, partial [Candidatus Nitrosotalea sp.]|nr:lamin tail domain-containing protein [Candidatus Nitrosotalea sp.]
MSFGNKPVSRLAFILAVLCSVSAVGQTNGVLREVFYNISGGTVAALTNSAKFPNSPDEEFIENSFEAPSNFADNYGQRMRALVLPPVTGTYYFWIASDDNSALYLSTDENPTHKVQIASETAWTNSREWNNSASQKSPAITLTNGFRYYIEALHAEGGGGDNLAVTWQKPGDPAPANGDPPIAGNYLIPYGLGPPVITVQPTNANVVEGGFATFTVQLARNLGVTFQWQRGTTDIPGATNSSYLISPVALSDSGSTFHCFIVNGYGSTNSATVTLTVSPDVTPPALTSVGSLGDPQILTVIFSEPVEAASATDRYNYTIDNGVTVLSAAFGTDTRTIVLTTTPMATKTIYTLTVNNVRDRATTPNTIAANSHRPFSLDSTPLDMSFVRPPPESTGPSSRHGPVVVSEIMYHPTNRVDGKNIEFVELFNSNPYFEDISGFRLTGEIDFTFPSNTVIAARAYLVVAAAPVDLQAVYAITNVTGPYTNKLANGSGTVKLLNRQGGVVFEVNYSSDPPWPVAADGAGHSLVLARPSLGERNPDAWAASDVIGGSPGLPESAGSNPYRTVLINEFLAHTDPPFLDYVELFNYSAFAVDLSGCVLTDDPKTNRFIVPTNTVIQPQGFVYFDETQLGFRLNAAGEEIYLKDPNNTRVIDALRFAAQQNGVATGRYPDGVAGFRRLQTVTPGAKNGKPLVSDVVINEIMYDPVSGDNDDQYVELYNHTAGAVDVGLWTLTDGIKYTIPVGTSIPANDYLVIAKNAARLMTNYPNLTGANTLGDFSGSLAHGGERIALTMPDEIASTNSEGQTVTNTIHIVVDDVTYGTGGRWGKWAHGGGSSLELIDPRSDHHLAPNWADSDETGKSGWTNIEFTGVLDNGSDTADSLQIILFGPGECLVDNVEVIPAGGSNLIPNSDFESGLTGWVPQGNHEDSSLEVGQGYNNSAQCLHIRAVDRGDTGANRIRTKLTTSLNSGQTVTLRAKVRWLAGDPEILLRLHGNWLEATGNILTARNLGTPGAPNSRARPDVGPAITDVKHSPLLPAANAAVTVVARVNDSDGLASLVLKYRIDPSTNLNAVTMANNGAGLFSGTIPGQPTGTLVAFHIQASDNFSPSAVTLFPNDAPTRECLVRWGDPAQGGNFGTYRIWMTQATLNRWSNREHLSNKPLDCTFVYGNSRVVYNMGGEYSGSPYHSPGFNSPIGNVCDYLVTFPDDDPLLGETDATLQWPGNGGGD